MTVDLAALRAALDAATQGEWHYGPWLPGEGPGSFSLFILGGPKQSIEARENNAAYIVAVQPRVVRELIAEVERLRSEVATVMQQRDEAHAKGVALGRDAATQEVERLREALEPFGDLAGEGVEDLSDAEPVVVKIGSRATYYGLKLGDLRRLTAALAGDRHEPCDR